MKPLHIGLLIAAGAIGGAVIMKVAKRPQIAALAPAPVPVAATRAVPGPAACAGTPPPLLSSHQSHQRKAAKHVRTHTATRRPHRLRRVGPETPEPAAPSPTNPHLFHPRTRAGARDSGASAPPEPRLSPTRSR